MTSSAHLSERDALEASSEELSLGDVSLPFRHGWGRYSARRASPSYPRPLSLEPAMIPHVDHTSSQQADFSSRSSWRPLFSLSSFLVSVLGRVTSVLWCGIAMACRSRRQLSPFRLSHKLLLAPCASPGLPAMARTAPRTSLPLRLNGTHSLRRNTRMRCLTPPCTTSSPEPRR